ncbi:hypothetical protein J4Q44_G00314730 [Coregonus suidteri]|uniref:Uncharacterized protein n=1 Tax=Coregonus suidteri TaxID=861788 RepID=A0AAN8KUS8_9TELE
MAKEAIKEAERFESTSIFTQFSVYKIAVLENNVEEAAGAVKAIGALAQGPVTSEDRLLVAENADSNLHQSGCSDRSGGEHTHHHHEQQDTAMKALESLCEHSKDEAQVVTALSTEIQKVSQLSPGPSMAVE